MFCQCLSSGLARGGGLVSPQGHLFLGENISVFRHCIGAGISGKDGPVLPLRNQRCFAHSHLRGTPHKESWRRQTAQGASKTARAHKPHAMHVSPHTAHRALGFCALNAHPLLTTSMAFVSSGFVLVRVRISATQAPLGTCACQTHPTAPWVSKEMAADFHSWEKTYPCFTIVSQSPHFY